MTDRITFWITLLCLTFLTSSFGFAQDHFESGELKGFTRSPEEHIINRIDVPFAVREVKGSAFIEISKAPLDGMLFKATLSGFQSVIGTIIVSRKAAADQVITIEMKVGV